MASVVMLGLPAFATTPSFDQLDANRDGKLSKSEVSKVKGLDFAKADTNKDGYLDKAEYKASIG